MSRSRSFQWARPVWTKSFWRSLAVAPMRRPNVQTISNAQSRPRPASIASSVTTLAWRAMLKIKHVPFQLFDVAVTPIMFTLLFTYIFGGALGGSPREYIQYL